jgi:peptidoglycan/LPS O-acetylase OafA/YrhL
MISDSPKQQTGSNSLSRLPILDGIRGIAVIMVVVTHFGSSLC